MNKRSKDKDKEILKRVQENDPTLTELNIGRGGGIFFQRATSSDFSALGAAIRKNTNITKLAIGIHGLAIETQYDYGNSGFSTGLRKNSTIRELSIRCYGNSITGAVSAVLQAFQTNNNLTKLEISRVPNLDKMTNERKQLIFNTLALCTNLKTIDIILDGGETLVPGYTNIKVVGTSQTENFKNECKKIVERSGQKNNSSPVLRFSYNSEPTSHGPLSIPFKRVVLNKDDLVLKDEVEEEDTGEAWKRVSGIILGQVVTYRQYFSTHYIRNYLQILLKTVKNGCCSNVGPGYMCGHCESSINVIRVSRAVILSICKLPLKKIRDHETSTDLKKIRSWIYNQVKEFKDDSRGEIKAVLPQKLNELIFSTKFDCQPPWEEDDFGILLQQPSPSWIIRINMLMLMGYKVALVNFNDIARFSRKDLKVVHSDFSRLLCPAENGEDDASDSESDVRVADDNVKTLFNQPPPADLHDDELFRLPPPLEDCPICRFRMPLGTGREYKSCCGKVVCSGCIYAVEKASSEDVPMCLFCSTPEPKTDKDDVERLKARMKLNDAEAIYRVGVYCSKGMNGYPQDHVEALELWNKAGDLGFAAAYFKIGTVYYRGEGGVEEDKKKAIHYWELAAMQGHVMARYTLGLMEKRAGNVDRALKHYMIAAKAGSEKSLGAIRYLHMSREATKDDFTIALRSYQAYLDEVKSDRRDEAAAYDEKKYKYY